MPRSGLEQPKDSQQDLKVADRGAAESGAMPSSPQSSQTPVKSLEPHVDTAKAIAAWIAACPVTLTAGRQQALIRLVNSRSR